VGKVSAASTITTITRSIFLKDSNGGKWEEDVRINASFLPMPKLADLEVANLKLMKRYFYGEEGVAICLFYFAEGLSEVDFIHLYPHRI